MKKELKRLVVQVGILSVILLVGIVAHSYWASIVFDKTFFQVIVFEWVIPLGITLPIGIFMLCLEIRWSRR